MFLFYLKRALQEVTFASVCVIWFQHCAHLNKPIEPRLIQNNILLCWPCPDSEAKKVFIPVPEHQGRRQRTALIESLVWFVSVEKHTPRAPQSGKPIDNPGGPGDGCARASLGMAPSTELVLYRRTATEIWIWAISLFKGQPKQLETHPLVLKTPPESAKGYPTFLCRIDFILFIPTKKNVILSPIKSDSIQTFLFFSMQGPKAVAVDEAACVSNYGH